MNARRIALALSAAVLMAGGSVSHADLITGWMDFQGVGLASNLQINYAPLGMNKLMVSAGQIRLSFQGTGYLGYCADLAQYAGDSQATALSPLTVARGDLAASLFETYGPAVSSNTNAAALGASIWEVLYEDPANGFDIRSGLFSIHNNNSVKTAAQAMLDSLPSSYTPAPNTVILHSLSRQDMMVSLAASGAVPEPCAAVLVAAGGLMCLSPRRRKAA